MRVVSAPISTRPFPRFIVGKTKEVEFFIGAVVSNTTSLVVAISKWSDCTS
jgi:hypothetical protein